MVVKTMFRKNTTTGANSITSVPITANNHTYHIAVMKEQKQRLNQPVNIFASGPSITKVNFGPLLKAPAIFVNGSISLVSQHDFQYTVAYVITDARFIAHSLSVLEVHYSGQPLYVTHSVLKAIARASPKILANHHQSITVITAADRPLTFTPKKLTQLLTLFSNKKVQSPPQKNDLATVETRKKSIEHIQPHPALVIDRTCDPTIGVSLNIQHGFIEAGTVTFVASQLAFTLGASEIHLYGLDLSNSKQPRFYETPETTAPCKLDKAISNRIVPSFDLLAATYQEHGVPIYNHSPISKHLFRNLNYQK